MLCPYRTNQRVTRKFKDYQGNGMFFDIESTFAPCDGAECPYFLSKDEMDGKEDDLCRKALAETFDVTAKVMALIAEDEED